ncbi:hypothetical protein APSETT444_001560 [Aspergillus pseudonomiae]
MATKRVVVAGGNGFLEWARADMLKPETYKPFLSGATAVVHTMGILLEADYKGVVQGREPIISGLQRAFSSSKLGSQNPLQRREGEPLNAKERDGQLTYELMNRDSALGGFIGSQFNELLGNRLDFLGTMVTKPFQVDMVGEAVVEAMEDEAVRGAVGTKKIEALATSAWRKSML